MSNLTVPTDYQNAYFTGDVDILPGLTAAAGNGDIFIRNGGLYVNGLTDLDQTTINTNDGEFNVNGPNKVSINISGGATSSVEIDAEDVSYFTTSAGTLTLSATNTGATGKVIVSAAGTGTDSVLVTATNTASGQVTISSAGGSTTGDAIRLLATDTNDGNILISAAGNFASTNPAIKLDASNSTSGQILLTSAGDDASSDAIAITATGSTNGNVLVSSLGTGNSVELYANNAAGKVYIHTTGTANDSINLVTAGGLTTTATGRIILNSADTTNGVAIATGTAGVPITLGTSTSLVTVAGNLDVAGTFTTINTETLEVADNVIVINSGGGEAGLDTGVLMKRFQTPNDAGTGDVINQPGTIQESGAFTATGTATTVTLALHSSDTTDFYKGWWILVTSGTGVNQVRRIKSYNGTTKVATIYATADNVVGPPAFSDGLDFTTNVATSDTYELYNRPYSTMFYGETLDHIVLGTVANEPNAIGDAGISTATVQQYQELSTGTTYVRSQVFNNAYTLGAGTSTVTVTIRDHGLSAGDRIRITNSASLTPAITSGVYMVATTPTANTFTFTAQASITSDDTSSSTTVTFLDSSALYANVISPLDNDVGGISFTGLIQSELINIPRTSTSFFFVNIAETYGTFMIHVSNTNDLDGAFSIFALAGNGTNNSITRIVSARGADGERIDGTWVAGQKPKIRHSPAASAGSPDPFIYRVRVYYG